MSEITVITSRHARRAGNHNAAKSSPTEKSPGWDPAITTPGKRFFSSGLVANPESRGSAGGGSRSSMHAQPYVWEAKGRYEWREVCLNRFEGHFKRVPHSWANIPRKLAARGLHFQLDTNSMQYVLEEEPGNVP